MERAKTDMVETKRPNNVKIYLSIAEKQNDCGLFYNTRLFFCQQGHHIGYLSQTYPNSRPEDINFQNPKMKVLITNIKSLGLTKCDLRIKFSILRNNVFSQRTWFIRFSNEILCKQWYDLLQKERTLASSFRQIKPEPEPEPVLQPIPQPPVEKDKKPLEIVSRNMQVAQKPKNQKDTREIGTSVSPKRTDLSKSRSKYNYQEQLTKLMNPASFRAQSGDKEKEVEYDLSTKALNKKESSLKSDPINRRDQNLSNRLLQISKNSEKSNNSSSNAAQSSNKNKYDIPESRMIEYQDVSPIQKFNHKKYFEENQRNSHMNNQNQYFQRTNKLIKNNHLEKYFGQRLEVPLNDFDDYQARTEKSPTFPLSTERANLPLCPYPLNSSILSKPRVPWTFKYIKSSHLMFPQFKSFTQILLFQLISDLSRPLQTRKYKMKLLKNSIAYFDIDDIQVKIAIIQLEDVKNQDKHNQTQKISSKAAIKTLENQFKNYNALYQYLGDSLQLRVPLVSLCEFQGFVGLFKAVSKNHDKLLRSKEIRRQIQDLKDKSKIDCNFNQNINRVIIELDHSFYDKYKTSEDSNLNFKLYFVQEIDHYLLPDVISDLHKEGLMVLRKELVDGYQNGNAPVKSYEMKVRKHFDPFEDKQHQKELENLAKVLMDKLNECIDELDSLSVYFMNSQELSHFLHSKGINIRYLGHIYSHLKTTFQKRIIMTEIASRSCKLLLRKTVQDIIMEQGVEGTGNTMHSKICDFLNCVLGKSYETAEFWKVLSAHAVNNFGVDLNVNEVDRWYFLISLVENCRLIVYWQRIKTEQAFKTDYFFTEKNLTGLSFHHKTYQPFYSEYYRLSTSIIERQQSREGFDQLVSYLNLKKQKIPKHLSCIESKIKKYLAYFISPEKANQPEYCHLGIYRREGESPSKLMFEILVIEIKWHLKMKQKQEYIKCCNQFLRIANKYYGEFHPIFGLLYDLFSAYHLTNSECEDSITFAKSSLVNTLKICGTNHQKTSQSYYHLSLCYLKANRHNEALAHLQKAKVYFQTAKKTQSIPYSIMSLRLGELFLNQTEVEMSLEATTNALNTLQSFQNSSLHQYEDEITECYEIMARCYEILSDKTEMKELSLHCFQKLKHTNKISNLQKLIKIYLYPVLSSLEPQLASTYIDIISMLPVEEREDSYEISYELIKRRIDEESFSSNLVAYLEKIVDIETHLKEREVLEGWQSFKEIYPRQTVKDFVQLTIQLISFLGQGFLIGCLREAL